MSRLSDEIIARIGSFGTAADMARISIINRRIGTLMENEKRIPAKIADTPNEVDFSWLRLYHELEMTSTYGFWQIKIPNDIGCLEGFQRQLERIRGTDHAITKMGEELDEDLEDFEPRAVAQERVEHFFRAVAVVPNLSQITVNYSWCSEYENDFDSSRLCWLLSPDSRYNALRILDLAIMTQEDVGRLAAAFDSSSSIETLCIMPIHIGYRRVQTILPIMQAISRLPNLKGLD
ncbi:hypothetical protein ACHAWO_004061 [Cyclotella atomus]|uniref:F-box domain-containing protein n=1 Tax=Cyclotella atomus TaxID=382360 RepID=A0ABD3N408_9STRA